MLNVPADVLQRFEGVGEFDDLAGGDLRIGEGSAGDEFQTAAIGVGCRSYIGHKRFSPRSAAIVSSRAAVCQCGFA